ncbi:MAG TPA: glutamate racemase [Chitinophagales bacterium]|nr:glutamate racemase [Chitinophagales bacterium]
MFPIGVFDSGYGGLTVLRSFKKALPEYDFIYLGDNARTPYGNRSFETVYEYTLECVNHLFNMGCRLVILACNTASAKALRTIQQNDLPKIDSSRRVLGVIRPTAEIIGKMTHTGTVGVFATAGTVQSESYIIEIAKAWPKITVVQEACPMWVPLIENNEYNKPGADYFVQQHMQQLLHKAPELDTILLGCTHYPLLIEKIKQFAPQGTTIIAQGDIVAESLVDYLKRHPEMESQCSKNGTMQFYTTDDTANFNAHASAFFGSEVQSTFLHL